MSGAAAIAVAVCLLATAVLVFAEYRDRVRLRAASKLVASSAFVAAALSWGALDHGYGQILLAGLVSCWLGDALLIPAGQGLAFQAGIAAFLLGHVAYAAAFAGLDPAPLALVLGALAMGAFGWSVLRWLRPHLPGAFRVPVLAYVIAISAMVVVAIAAVAGGATPWIALGAVGFAASDLSVARARFVREGFVNAAWGLPAYFVSQLVLARTVHLSLH